MWDKVGIVRNEEDLQKALAKLNKLDELFCIQNANPSEFETKNIIQTAILVTKAALKRKKTLGCHFIY